MIAFPPSVLFFQSCQGFYPLSLQISQLETGKIDPQCLTSQNYDACIFLANPVATLKRALSSNADLELGQQYAIKIPESRLSNSLVVISPSAIPAAVAQESGRWAYRMSTDPAATEQVHNYYWATLFLAHMQEALGAALPRLGPIYLDTHSTIPADLEVDFGKSIVRLGRQLPAALDHSQEAMASNGELIIEALGQILALRMNAKWATSSPATHESTCTNFVHCSCKTSDGCSAALVLGTATLFRYLFFEQFQITAAGDTLVNQSGGVRYCGLNTALSDLTSLSRNDAFSACAGLYEDASPNAYSLGLLVAAIWAPLFSQSVYPNHNPAELFSLIAQTVGAGSEADTLITFFRRAGDIDRANFSGRYGPALRQVLSQHGVQL